MYGARILNCFMHLGMLEAIEIRMEIVSGNFRCLSISNFAGSPPLSLTHRYTESERKLATSNRNPIPKISTVFYTDSDISKRAYDQFLCILALAQR